MIYMNILTVEIREGGGRGQFGLVIYLESNEL